MSSPPSSDPTSSGHLLPQAGEGRGATSLLPGNGRRWPRAAGSDEGGRFSILDAIRGVALVAMFAYHITWDLGYFGLIASDIPDRTDFKDFGHTIATVFFLLVGASLVLAARGGVNYPAYFRRLGMIVAAAAAISAVTYFLFPDEFIYFGILHCIAVATLAALVFIRAPLWLALIAALAAIAAPFFISTPALDGPFIWIGLGTTPPPTLDWRPFLPWFGVVLAGLMLARIALLPGPIAAKLPAWFTNWKPRNPFSSALVWGGRHSLFVYLIHQPIFVAILFVVAKIVVPAPVDDAGPFLSSCISQCKVAGASQDLCESICSCVVAGARSQGLWDHLRNATLSPVERESYSGIVQECGVGRK